MVQKEVKKKAQVYALMAILLASMCVALIYSVGTSPGTTPFPSPFPSGTPNPNPQIEISPIKTFSSYEELKNFLATNNQTSYYRSDLGSFGGQENQQTGAPVPAPTTAPAASLTDGSAKDYSTTNIQVAGVDEADTVKTDGKYLYVIANNTVYIINADSQNAKVLSKIPFQNAYISGVYLSQDGRKLAVLGSQYTYYVYADWKGLGVAMPEMYPYWNNPATFVYVYDVSNKNSPTLQRNFTISGSYANSRMIGNYVYTIVTQSAYLVNNIAILPTVYSEKAISTIAPNSIYYTNVADSSYSYTTFIAMNILDNEQGMSNMTIMMGGAGEVYVSQDNIYVTYPVYDYEVIPLGILPPTATTSAKPTENSSGSNSSTPSDVAVMPVAPIWRPTTPKTAIYRIHVSGGSMSFAAQGNVTGTVLNQYFMDESNNYFRIATTAWIYDSSSYSGTQQNNVYVLDMNLNTIGKIENLGTGENFKSARFMGNRCYLVTFMNTDPLFVVDLSQPTQPRLLGELIMPGYSDYLHPYDETHLIGVGKDAVLDSNNNFAWYQGLKLSLFDVSDVAAPKEVAKVSIGDRGTNSEVLYNPKAFLFDRSRDLLVIPVDLYVINANESTTPDGRVVPSTEPSPSTVDGKPVPLPTSAPSQWGSGPSTYGQFVWQGVYIFKVTLSGGFELRGNVTQLSREMLANLVQDRYYYTGYDNSYNYWITRSLYIENKLYTISNARVQLNSLTNLALLATVDLS
jgi:inhibitor of cysteine peptidase